MERVNPNAVLWDIPVPEGGGFVPGDAAYLPGLAPDAPPTPALVLTLFDSTGARMHTANGRVHPIASGFLEAILDVRPADRDVRAALWPNSPLSLGRIVGKLDAAAQMLASNAAAWPWHDSATGKAGYHRVVRVVDIPATLDGALVLEVSAPPSVSGQGPILPAELDAVGARDKYGYRALITAAFDWYRPGATLKPNAPRGGWAQGSHPAKAAEAYAVYTDADLLELLAPRTSTRDKRHVLDRIRQSLRQLDAAELIHLADVGRRERRMLPPSRTPAADSD